MTAEGRGRPLLLDLYCCAGGAAVGYHRAGFEVVGVDIRPQRNYPFEFVQANALEAVLALLAGGIVAGRRLDDFAGIHASPPCQAKTRARVLQGREHPDLIPETRELLEQTGLPFVIENVEGAELRDPTVLCGTSFGLGHDGFELRRHRLFETNFPALALPCAHRLPAIPVFGHGPNADFYRRYGRGFSAADRKAAMGIDWMNRDELSEAIPPAMTEHIGSFLMAAVRGEEARDAA